MKNKEYIKDYDRDYIIELAKELSPTAKVMLYRIALMYIFTLKEIDANMAHNLKEYLEKCINLHNEKGPIFSSKAILEILLIQKEVILLHYLSLKSIS